MIKNLKIKDGIITCLVGFTLITEAGCSFPFTDKIGFFNNNEDTISYYDIKKNGNNYFVSKDDLGDKIPVYNNTYYVGLRLDENGNTIVVDYDNIVDTDDIITCMKTHASSDNYPYGIYISGVDSVEIVDDIKKENETPKIDTTINNNNQDINNDIQNNYNIENNNIEDNYNNQDINNTYYENTANSEENIDIYIEKVLRELESSTNIDKEDINKMVKTVH